MRVRRKPEGGWQWGNDDSFSLVEVPPGFFDISDHVPDDVPARLK